MSQDRQLRTTIVHIYYVDRFLNVDKTKLAGVHQYLLEFSNGKCYWLHDVHRTECLAALRDELVEATVRLDIISHERRTVDPDTPWIINVERCGTDGIYRVHTDTEEVFELSADDVKTILFFR